ncbi:MAG: hypothetical protein WCA77_05535, partial [Thermoplasmata archaeon]
AQGSYSLNVTPGSYAVTASLSGYGAVVATVDVTNQNVVHNFSLQPTYVVDGTVRYDSNDSADRSATVELTAGSSHTTENVSSQGIYSFLEVNGTYTVVASQTGYGSKTATLVVNGRGVTHSFYLVKSDPSPLARVASPSPSPPNEPWTAPLLPVTGPRWGD